MQLPEKATPVFLAIITTILVIAALKYTRPITMPLAFAFFITVLVHPLQRWLNRYVPRWLSLIIVLAVLAGILGLAVGALSLSAEIIEPKLPGYLDQIQQMANTARTWASNFGLPTEQLFSSSQGSSNQVVQQAIGGLRSLLSALSLFVLVVSLLVLLLLEVSQYHHKVEQAFPSTASHRLVHAVSNTSDKLRRYLGVMALTSLITGLLTIAWCFVLGVDLAFVWGLIAFVLNFVPTLGSIIAVIPPTLVALVFQGVGKGIATLVGLAVIQVVMGNFVDPRLQGKSLELSPFVALVSIVFWGWVWGIPGAILGVPMTIAIVLVCQEFKSTQGISILLSEYKS
ncbi:MAG: AI-2E family transporter [Thainema sp.]